MFYTIIIFLSIIAIEIFLIYSPVYVISYELLKLDKKVGDTKLFRIILLITAALVLIVHEKLSIFILSLFFS